MLDQWREPRIRWTNAAGAPDELCGPRAVHDAGWAIESVWNTYRTQHGSHDDHFGAEGLGAARRTGTSGVRDLHYFPQRANPFTLGSQGVVYGAAPAIARH